MLPFHSRSIPEARQNVTSGHACFHNNRRRNKKQTEERTPSAAEAAKAAVAAGVLSRLSHNDATRCGRW